jgi:L-alanine-DL-glutamate epimerase-like enolase superfamily enzyme
MKITDVEVVNLRFEYPHGEGYQTKRGRTTGGLTSLVSVSTSQGLNGIGPVYTHPDLLRIIVEEHLKPFLIGRDPRHTEELWAKLYRLTQWYGRKGVGVSAVGGVDTALWDIRGKAEGKPLWRLLGGTTPSVAAYGSGLLWEADPLMQTGRAAELRRRGFTRVKTRTGVNQEYDRAVVDAVIKGIGPGGEVMVDGSHRYPLKEAIAFAEFLGERNIVWFEEPFSPGDIESYCALRKVSPVPIAAGENEFGVEGFRELFHRQAIDIAQPDVSRVGGITECLRIAALAQEYDIIIAPHTWSDAVTIIANSHVVASVPGAMTVEVNQTGNPLVEELIDPPLRIENGKLLLPDGPGLGIELQPEALEKYRMDRHQHVKGGHYSDMTFGGEWDWMWPPYPVATLPERPT